MAADAPIGATPERVSTARSCARRPTSCVLPASGTEMDNNSSCIHERARIHRFPTCRGECKEPQSAKASGKTACPSSAECSAYRRPTHEKTAKSSAVGSKEGPRCRSSAKEVTSVGGPMMVRRGPRSRLLPGLGGSQLPQHRAFFCVKTATQKNCRFLTKERQENGPESTPIGGPTAAASRVPPDFVGRGLLSSPPGLPPPEPDPGSLPHLSSSLGTTTPFASPAAPAFDLGASSQPSGPAPARKDVSSLSSVCDASGDVFPLRGSALREEGEFSFESWIAALPRLLRRGRTQLSRFLLSTLNLPRGFSSPTAALFPLPLSLEGIFLQRACRDAASRRRLAVQRCTHLVAMCLNFMHAGCKPVPLRSLQRPLSSLQAQVYERIAVLVRACARRAGPVPVCAGVVASTLLPGFRRFCVLSSGQGSLLEPAQGMRTCPRGRLSCRTRITVLRPCSPTVISGPIRLPCLGVERGTSPFIWTLIFTCLLLSLKC